MKRLPAKVLSLLLALAMLLPLLAVGISAKEAEGWWTKAVWDTETLVSLHDLFLPGREAG